MNEQATGNRELCEELRNALADLEARAIEPPPESRPEFVRGEVSLDRTTLSWTEQDVLAEIERIKDDLRRNGCE
ncbi:MAG: hypothetical protein R3C39_12935 [Dehalococcoidia bacterium]